jgi:hypothetical protein
MARTTYEIKTELRPCVCKVNGSWTKALFHGWIKGKPEECPIALVELPNGFMGKANYDEFYFLDGEEKFSEYCWVKHE